MEEYLTEILPKWEGLDIIRCFDRRWICIVTVRGSRATILMRPSILQSPWIGFGSESARSECIDQ